MIGRILLGLLGLIVLVLVIPVRVKLEYIGEWHGRILLFGVIPVFTFPVPEKPTDKPQDSAPPPEQETALPKEEKPSLLTEFKTLFREEGISGVLHFFGKLIEMLKTTLRSLVRFITVRKLALCVRVGGEEADDTAVRYGQISAALAASLEALSQLVRIKRPQIRVLPDFTAYKTEARLRMIVWIWPFGVIGAGIAALFKFLSLWIKTMKTPLVGDQTIKQSVLK